MELLERKKENQRLLDEEFLTMKGKNQKEPAPGKVTRAQIENTLQNEQQKEQNELKPKGTILVLGVTWCVCIIFTYSNICKMYFICDITYIYFKK